MAKAKTSFDKAYLSERTMIPKGRAEGPGYNIYNKKPLSQTRPGVKVAGVEDAIRKEYRKAQSAFEGQVNISEGEFIDRVMAELGGSAMTKKGDEAAEAMRAGTLARKMSPRLFAGPKAKKIDVLPMLSKRAAVLRDARLGIN